MAARNVRLAKMIAPLLIHLGQLFELRLEVVDRVSGRLFGRWIELGVRRRLRGVQRLRGLASLVAGPLLLLVRFRGFDLLKGWVLFELLRHKRFEFERRRL